MSYLIELDENNYAINYMEKDGYRTFTNTFAEVETLPTEDLALLVYYKWDSDSNSFVYDENKVITVTEQYTAEQYYTENASKIQELSATVESLTSTKEELENTITELQNSNDYLITYLSELLYLDDEEESESE